jgi:catalase (peroxidase I)
VQRRRIEHSTLIVIGHGGPLFVGVTWRSSDTYHQAGIRAGDRHLNFYDSRDNLWESPAIG